MTVAELKEVTPISDVIELRADAKYLVRVSKNIPLAELQNISRALQIADVTNVIVVMGDDIKFYDFDSSNKKTSIEFARHEVFSADGQHYRTFNAETLANVLDRFVSQGK